MLQFANEDEKSLPNRKSMPFPTAQTLQACDARPALCLEQGHALPATRAAPALAPAALERPSIALPGFRRGFWAYLQTCEINNSYARNPLLGRHGTRCLLCSRPVSHLFTALFSHRRCFLTTSGHTAPSSPAGCRGDVVTPKATSLQLELH